MKELDWNIEGMQPMEFNFIPCEPAYSDYIQNALRRCQLPAHIIEALENFNYAQVRACAIAFYGERYFAQRIEERRKELLDPSPPAN